MAKLPEKTPASKARERFRRSGKRIEKLAQKLGEALPSGLRLIGEEIMLDVKASRPGAGVPVDKGPLRASGRVEGPEGINGVVTLSFGGAAAVYALVQHEDTSLRHKVGEARYLVRGVERWRRDGVSARRARQELQRAIDAVASGQPSIAISPASSRAGSFSSS